MAFTYKWSELVNLVLAQTKNQVTGDSIDVIHCDMVSSQIAARYPWKSVETTFEDGQIPLVNNTQDYSVPPNLWRLGTAWLIRTAVDPHDTVNLDIRDSLAIDLKPRSPYTTRAVSLEAGVGLLRLETAVQIPSGDAWQLQGTYQINPTKVIATTQPLWIEDHYAWVAVEGLTYWYYKLADDPRAGTAASDGKGSMNYTGQLAVFMDAVKQMTDAEDIGGNDQLFPSDPLGIGRQFSYPTIFGF